ncbi:hypothetical protein LINGRAHAP2_LOCUS36302 [Linum grandiflorum]
MHQYNLIFGWKVHLGSQVVSPPRKLLMESTQLLFQESSVKEMSMKRLSKKSLPLRLMLWNWISAPWHP